ncbi:MAG TPA: alpha/beta hydrolase [Candidatus Sulfotelmatobacter sp.]|nr:alpha/beta hydrolase [Candidatus Sulfotelmatobacter sp.]
MQSGYAPINGLRLYYETHGASNPARAPLVLLHGGGDTIKTSFGVILPELARDRQVVAFEQQGYGHTTDIADRPFSFEQSADDTAALLEYLHIPQVDLFGFSSGGTVALQVAIRPSTTGAQTRGGFRLLQPRWCGSGILEWLCQRHSRCHA